MASPSQHITDVAAVAIKEVEKIIKDPSVLEVDSSLPDRDSRPAGPSTRIAGETEADEGRVRRRHTKESTKPKKPSCVGGERLLRYLVRSANCRQSNIKIRLPGMRREFTVSRLFRSFSDIAAPAKGAEGQWHGFWGRLTGSDVDMKYLNTGDSDAACIIIDETIRNARIWAMEDDPPKCSRSILPRIRHTETLTERSCVHQGVLGKPYRALPQ